MKKRISRIRVNKKKSHSDALLRNQLLSLLSEGAVVTTSARAKVLVRFADREITYARSLERAVVENSLAKRLHYPKVVDRMKAYMAFLSDDDTQRNYTSIVKVGFRSGDNAELSEVELYKGDDFKKMLSASMPKKKRKSTRKPASDKAKTEKRSLVQDGTSQSKKSQKKEKSSPKEGTVPDQKKKGLFNSIGGRILGRKVRTPDSVGKGGRSTARSGI